MMLLNKVYQAISKIAGLVSSTDKSAKLYYSSKNFQNLTHLIDFLSVKSNWNQEYYALNSEGKACNPMGLNVCALCLEGAAIRFNFPTLQLALALCIYRQTNHVDPISFNDENHYEEIKKFLVWWKNHSYIDLGKSSMA